MSLDMNQLQAVEAEQAILGSVFIDNNVMNDIHNLLEMRDFSIESHQLLWNVMQYRFTHNEPIDLITVVDRLKKYNILEKVGDVTYISKIASATPSAKNAAYYVKIVRERAFKQRGLEVAAKIKNLSEDLSIDSEDFFQRIEKLACSIRPNSGGDMKHVSQTKKEYMDFLEEQDDLLMTGFKPFDDWMGGVGRGWLYIMAGRPSVGKTAKALQMVKNIASQDKGDVLLYSQEMTTNQLKNRMMAAITGISGNRIRKKMLEPFEKEKISNAYDELEKFPLHISDAKGITIDDIRAEARNIKRKTGKLGAIFVDYLTILKIVQQPGQSWSQAVGYVTRTAKQMAMELDVPFIMLAQLNRAGAGEPKMEHLRDSGEIEQDADVIEFLWENPEDTHREGKVVQSIIAKGRDVGVNNFRYLFKGWIQKYESLE